MKIPVVILWVKWSWKQLGPMKTWYPTISLYNVTTPKAATWKSSPDGSKCWHLNHHYEPHGLDPTGPTFSFVFQNFCFLVAGIAEHV